MEMLYRDVDKPKNLCYDYENEKNVEVQFNITTILYI
jgi:hypothetical protein